MMLKSRLGKQTLNLQILYYLKKFLNECTYSECQIREIQFQRLKSFLVRSYVNHSFYKERFDACGFDPFKFKNTEEMKVIPPLLKEEYRSYCKALVNENGKKYYHWYKDNTSGSTGKPLTVYRSWRERAYMSAKWLRVLFLNGYSWFDTTFSIPSPHRLQRDSFIQNFGLFKRISIPYSATVEEMVDGYLKSKPAVLYANKSQLVMMAVFCERYNISLVQPKLCISSAETMDENSKKIIGKVFGSDALVEAYGAVEVNNLAWQQKGDVYFRFSQTTNFLEVIDESGEETTSGSCLITDFFIDSFPLIRYKLGDFVETEKINGIHELRKIKGRLDDTIIFADGERIPFHPFYEILGKSEILQFRVIQENFNVIRLLVVKDAHAERETLEKQLIRDLRREVREKDIQYVVEWLDEIPPDLNGKLRILISKVQQGGSMKIVSQSRKSGSDSMDLG